MPLDTECDSEAGRPGASCGFPLGYEVTGFGSTFTSHNTSGAFPPEAPSFTNAGLLSHYVELSQLFLDQTVALLNLPTLAEFEENLRSRLRDTANAVSIFQTEWWVDLEFGFHSALRCQGIRYMTF